jgi:hypothetical protein
MQDDPTPPGAVPADPAGDERGAPAAEPTPTLTRMLALWRTATRCQPVTADPSATLVPAAAPRAATDDDDAEVDDADAATTRRWRAG